MISEIDILLDYLIKTQVDFMLGSYMEDIGITAKEFEAACTQGKSITGKFHQQLFEQVPILDCRLRITDYRLWIRDS